MVESGSRPRCRSFVFLMGVSLWATVNGVGQTDTLKVVGVYRISHPAYQIANIWYSVRNPWNRDYTRILLYEVPYITHPVYQREGRGLVWGYVEDLKRWRTLDDYERVARPIVENWSASAIPPTSVYWSPHNGEENILYLLHRPTNTVWRLNVDTGRYSVVASYDPADGTDVSGARALGWTTDGLFIVNFDNERYNSGGFLIDVLTGRRNRYSRIPDVESQEARRWPTISHGHSHKSPDGSMMAWDYGRVGSNGVRFLGEGRFVEDLTFEERVDPPWPHSTNYVSWKASNGWFLACSGQFTQGKVPSYLTRPTIVEYVMWQVTFDGTDFSYHELMRVKTAGRWDPDADHTNGNEVRNYHAHLVPVLRPDGRAIFFTATDSAYSYEDYKRTGATPWDFVGAFVAELSPVSVAVVPPPPRRLDVVAVKLDDAILLAWPSSQGSGISYYTVYRDGLEIATLTDTFYADPGAVFEQSHTYQILAMGTSGEVVEQSERLTIAPLATAGSSVAIPRVASRPVLDGDLSEYRNVKALTMPLNGPGDSATVRLMWDPEFLWIGYQVVDSRIQASQTQEDGAVWGGDSVEWFIGLGEVYGIDSTRSPQMYLFDRHGIVNALGEKYDAAGSIQGRPEPGWDGRWEAAVRTGATGYSVEVRVPWADLGSYFKPSEGSYIRLGVAANDRDDNQLFSVMWPSRHRSFENRYYWVVARLARTVVDPVDRRPPERPGNVRIIVPGTEHPGTGP